MIAAILGGVALALAFRLWRPLERAFFPFAVVMQVTPIISIAPLLLVYLSSGTAVLVCAFLVAFFPILSNTALGLASADHNLIDLFELYGASSRQQLLLLRLPTALPYFLGGLRIGGGLALIGAIVAEIAAGSAGSGRGTRVSHRRIGISAQHPAHVRGAVPDLDHRHPDIPVLHGTILSAAASLARQRARARAVKAK